MLCLTSLLLIGCSLSKLANIPSELENQSPSQNQTSTQEPVKNITIIVNNTIKNETKIELACDCESIEFACVNGSCVPRKCQTDDECVSSLFYCINGFCKGNICSVNEDCFDVNPFTTDICDVKTKHCANKEIKPVCLSGDDYCSFGCNDWEIDEDCGGVPRVWDLVASNDPEEYLSDFISTEKPSQWKEYEPLKNKVLELTNGITDDYEKARRIADWVQRSRPYDEASLSGGDATVANKGGSVIEIFNEKTGVCLDSAILLTAMLRQAGIPARAISPAFGYSHEYTEAYLGSKWIGIDATYNPAGSESEAYFIDETSTPNDFSTVTYVVTPLSEFQVFRNDYERLSSGRYFQAEVTVKSTPVGYGYISYPNTAQQLFYSPTINPIISPTYGPKTNTPGLVSCGLLPGSWSCDYYSCRKSETTEYEPMWSLIFVASGLNKDGNHQNIPISKNGYLRVAYPAGKWRFTCEFANHKIAYKDFDINAGEEIKITPDSLDKYPNATAEQFDMFINMLKKATKNI